MSKVVLFGAGKIAEVVYHQLRHDSRHEVVALTVDPAWKKADTIFGLPVVLFDDVTRLYPPDKFEMFIAIGYQDLNAARAAKYHEAKAKGYKLITYVSSRANNFSNRPIGDNCLVFENVTLQPGCSVGNNVFLWSGNHVGHHSSIEDHCYIAGQVVLSGNSVIEPNCFVGVNATIGNAVRVGRESFLGAGSLVTKDVAPKSVHIVADTPKFRLDSESFLKMTKFS